jgi:hypothetical protein
MALIASLSVHNAFRRATAWNFARMPSVVKRLVSAHDGNYARRGWSMVPTTSIIVYARTGPVD